MFVRDLIRQLSACDPNATIETWTVHDNGDSMDSVTSIEFTGIDAHSTDTIFLTLKLPKDISAAIDASLGLL